MASEIQKAITSEKFFMAALVKQRDDAINAHARAMAKVMELEQLLKLRDDEIRALKAEQALPERAKVVNI